MRGNLVLVGVCLPYFYSVNLIVKPAPPVGAIWAAKQKRTGFPERYQVGEGCHFRPAWLLSLEQTRALCSWYPNSFRHLQVFDPSARRLMREHTLKDRLYDPGRPKSRHPALIWNILQYSDLKLQYSVILVWNSVIWFETSVFSDCNRDSSKTWTVSCDFRRSRRQKRAFQSIGPLTLMLIRLFSLDLFNAGIQPQMEENPVSRKHPET